MGRHRVAGFEGLQVGMKGSQILRQGILELEPHGVPLCRERSPFLDMQKAYLRYTVAHCATWKLQYPQFRLAKQLA